MDLFYHLQFFYARSNTLFKRIDKKPRITQGFYIFTFLLGFFTGFLTLHLLQHPHAINLS